MQSFFGHNCAYSVSSQVEGEEKMAMLIHTRRVYLKKVPCSWALVWHCNPCFIPDLSVAVNPTTLRPFDGTVVAINLNLVKQFNTVLSINCIEWSLKSFDFRSCLANNDCYIWTYFNALTQSSLTFGVSNMFLSDHGIQGQCCTHSESTVWLH